MMLRFNLKLQQLVFSFLAFLVQLVWLTPLLVQVLRACSPNGWMARSVAAKWVASGAAPRVLHG